MSFEKPPGPDYERLLKELEGPAQDLVDKLKPIAKEFDTLSEEEQEEFREVLRKKAEQEKGFGKHNVIWEITKNIVGEE
jgi:hypothetical protein